MKTCITLIVFLISAFCANGYSSDVERDVVQLRKLALAVRIYMEANNGQVPSNLEPLRDYIDVAKMLGAVPGSNIKLTERYSLLAAKPTINLPGKGAVQVVLLGVKSEDGRRMAIWIGKDGLPDTGLLPESELMAAADKKIDLKNLKPMGGMVPKTSEKVLAAADAPNANEYQARVMALVREGKIPLDTPNPNPSTPTATPLEATMPQSTPRPAVSALPKATVETKASSSFPIVPVGILLLGIFGVAVFFLRRKSP